MQTRIIPWLPQAEFIGFCSRRPRQHSPSAFSAPSVALVQGLRSLWVSRTGQQRKNNNNRFYLCILLSVFIKKSEKMNAQSD